MNHQDFVKHFQHRAVTALLGLNFARLGELADRGDTAEIGRIVAHALEAAKHEAEQLPSLRECLDRNHAPATLTLQRTPFFGPDELPIPAFLRRQAD